MARDESTMGVSDTAPLWERVRFDSNGLIPAIATQSGTGEVLMMAWMNRETLRETLETGRAVYWSRSRGRPWRKGETSGQMQTVLSVRLDCDGDTLLLEVDQKGVACHTGRRSCFYLEIDPSGNVRELCAPEVDPAVLYGDAAKG
ncbi:phosphoribosyl-AMP cyclohydrolase [Phaeovibrio sulfidiphilus]|nr:phosphoribosyl-AMP cyclohydrolase [Phaeovibrio sulfidiphilus]